MNDPTGVEKRILVVEDEQAIRHVLSTFLKNKGCEVSAAGTGEEALELLGGSPFSVVVLDIVLPGMNGLEVLSRVKEAAPDTEVIMMTSQASIETATEAIRLGAYDYLQKPFEELETVWETVRRALEKHTLTCENRVLVGSLEERNQDLSLAIKRRDSLIEAGQAMAGTNDLAHLLDLFVGLAADELDVERASLMLVNHEAQELNIAASRGLPEDVVRKTRVPLGDGIAGRVALTGEPVLVTDTKLDDRVSGKVPSELTSSFVSAPITISIPIKAQQSVVGVINVTNRKSGVPFSEDDVEFIESLAGQLAVAIERARHVTDLEKAIASLETTQNQLVATERLKAFGELAAGVSHDFNNILNGILGRAQSLLGKHTRSDLPDDLLVAGLRSIEQLSMQAAATVNRIQDYTRIRKDRSEETVDLNQLVRDAAAITRPQWKQRSEANGYDIDMNLDLCEAASTGGSHGELVQVVSNLILNAVEAMPQGGCLTLRTQCEGPWIHLTVSDTGIGMEPEVQSRVFEPFFTTKDQGQGLGASVIYGIVSRHRGEITVESEPGRGTTFHIRLPLENAQAPEVIEANVLSLSGPDTELEPLNVLVIEDEEHNRDLFEEILIDAGHEVWTAADGREGLRMLGEHPIDVVITDLSMPGMSGWDVSKAVKARKPEAKVIMISGWAVQQEKEKAAACGVDDILPKPCPTVDLLGAVVRVVEGNRAA